MTTVAGPLAASTRVARSSETRSRQIPADAPETIKVGRLTAKKVAQSADMVRYVVHLQGKPTYVDVVEKFNPRTALKVPEGFLKDRKAVVLTDRDGVLNKATSFLNKPADVTGAAMIPAALTGAKALNEAGVGLAIVTNQGGYQIGKMSFEDTLAVNIRVAQQLSEAGGRVDAIVICPFNGPLASKGKADVDARKPSPGMPLHVSAMAGAVGLKTVAMVGDQRTDGAAGQGAGLKFFAITDPANGRWEAEPESAKRKNEKLPELKRGAAQLEKVPDFAATAREVLADLARKPAGGGRTGRSDFTTGPSTGGRVERPSSGAAAATGALQTLRGTEKTSELPAPWLRAATAALQEHAAEDPRGYYDYRVAVHGDAASKLAKNLTRLDSASGGPAFEAGKELLLVNVHGGDELAAEVFALDVLTQKVRTLGSLDYDTLETAIAWDGFKAPDLFKKGVLLPISNTAWDSGDQLAGFDELARHTLAEPLDFEKLVKLGPSQEPRLSAVGAALAKAPDALSFYKLALGADSTSLTVRSGSASEKLTAAPGTTFTAAGWSTGASIEAALAGVANPRLDAQRWLDADDALSASRFGSDTARPLLWLEQSDGAVRFLAFSAKPEKPVVLEVQTRPLLVSVHGKVD